MADAGHTGHLGAVYSAKGQDEVADIYDRWAKTYDAEMAAAGYRHPSISVALLTRHLPAGPAPLLDAGAGTGLLGEWLGIIGYSHVEALDLSTGMLAVAERKGVYAALHQVGLGGPLPFTDAYFAGIISAGVFTSGHVGGEALPELIRICRPGGVIILTVKDTVWADGFGAAVAALEAEGKIAAIDETPPYVSMPGVAGTVPSRGVVFRVAG